MQNIKLLLSSMEEQLEQNGYLMLPGFLSNESVNELLEYYKIIGLNSEKTQPNYLYANPQLSKEISAKIKLVLQKDLAKVFSEINFLGGVFMAKKPGANKEVDFHQDWSLVDENKFASYNLWSPLVNTNTNSGALMLMSKSNQAGLPYRSSTLPPLELKYDKKYTPFIKNFVLSAGDAILYKHSMFHGSGNNNGTEERIAIACGVIPSNADFIYQHWNQEKSMIESYKVDNDFYIEHIFDVLSGNIPSKYTIVKETAFENKPTLDEPTFYKKMRKLHGLKRFLFFD